MQQTTFTRESPTGEGCNQDLIQMCGRACMLIWLQSAVTSVRKVCRSAVLLTPIELGFAAP